MIRKATCNKCGSVKINITWKYRKADEMDMLLCHDGYGFQYEDAAMKCYDCNSKDIINLRYNKDGKLIEEKE